ncbi:MAG: hypothetical protein JWP52_1515 [Rhizobacter sp.]|nr:hypothetical protein [Rhizobacter sp.]
MNPRLEAEVSALAGQASITWGYRQLDASDAAMRTEGRIDMAGCVIDLKLSGEVVHEGARSRVRLSAKGRSDWAMRLAQIASIALPDESLNDAVRTLQLPFVLEVEPLANTELSTLFAADMAEPMFGALVADYGLRPRADGAGFQWFFTLRVDPVTALFEWREPLLGHDLHSRTLLPAMTLVDWSAG